MGKVSKQDKPACQKHSSADLAVQEQIRAALQQINPTDEQSHDHAALASSRLTKRKLDEEFLTTEPHHSKLKKFCTGGGGRQNLGRDDSSCGETSAPSSDEAHQEAYTSSSAEVLMQDFILLHIFKYLTASELVNRVGPVCTTWRRVSKDPSLWEDKELFYPAFVPNPWQFLKGYRIRHDIQYMRIAPKLKHLCINFLYGYPESLSKLLATSRCQVSSLHLEIHCECILKSVLKFLRRQKLCLKVLSIYGRQLNDVTAQTATALWKIVGGMSKLKELQLKNCSNLLEYEYKAVPSGPLVLEKITVVNCDIIPQSALQVFVKASTRSLQILELPSHVCGHVLKELSLKDCINIKALQIPCHDQIAEIENCSQLEILKINSPMKPVAVLSVAKFLKNSLVVRNLVKFEVSCPSGFCCNKLAQSISYMPNLRELKIDGSIQHPMKDMAILLRKVCRLEKLCCNTFPLVNSDVEAIVNGLMPDLKELTVPYQALNNIRDELIHLKSQRNNLKIMNLIL